MVRFDSLAAAPTVTGRSFCLLNPRTGRAILSSIRQFRSALEVEGEQHVAQIQVRHRRCPIPGCQRRSKSGCLGTHAHALLPAGTTRYATATYTGPDAITVPDGWVDLPGMTKYITIPGGHVADVMVTFCGLTAITASACAYCGCLCRDAAGLSRTGPIATSNLNGSSQCASVLQDRRRGGSPAVKVQWHGVLAPAFPSQQWRSAACS